MGSNIIELCPVGALTSKLYSFKYRSWDSIYFESSDITSALLSPIRLYTRGSKVSRVLPQYDDSFEWGFLSEKARYIYDSFNIQRLNTPLIKNYNLKQKMITFFVPISWLKLKYFFLNYNIKTKKYNSILPILGQSCDIIFINYIKYLFFKNGYNNFLYDEFLMHSETNNLNYDYRNMYLTNSQDLYNINICFLINIKLRTENPLFNAKLRQEYLWNNIKIYQFGPKMKSSYKYTQLSTDINSFYKILRGKTTSLISLCLKQSKILCLASTYNMSQFSFDFLTQLQIMFSKKTINFIIRLNAIQFEQIGFFELNIMSKIHTNLDLKKKYMFFFNTNKAYLKKNIYNPTNSLYQSSHFNNSYNFVDLFIPITTLFETRIKIYINLLGLLRRIPKIIPFYKLDILDDLDSLYFIILVLPILNIKLNSNTILYKLYFNLPLKIYTSIQTYNIFLLKIYYNKFNFRGYYYNTIYSIIYKNFYKTTYLDKTSASLTTLTNIFFNNSKNYYS